MPSFFQIGYTAPANGQTDRLRGCSTMQTFADVRGKTGTRRASQPSNAGTKYGFETWIGTGSGGGSRKSLPDREAGIATPVIAALQQIFRRFSAP
jgi:hypothetical protein